MARKKESININFENIEDLNNFINRVIKELVTQNDKHQSSNKPLVYGFSVRIDGKGTPVVDNFGNVKPEESNTKLNKEREPLVDIIEKPTQITVIIEIPGVKKNDIQITADHSTVKISTSNLTRSYNKTVSLTNIVDPSAAQAKYNNGILEITFNKAKYRAKPARITVT